MPHVILTAIGADRPGLVDEVAEFVFGRGGNIEDSRMVNLRGQFAIMMLVAGDSSVLDRLRRETDQLSRQTNLHAEVHQAQSLSPAEQEPSLPYRLKATAIDQPGLVHRVAHVLRAAKVNIESLDTQLTDAPYTGAPMFEMELIVAIPKSTPLSQLRQDIARLCDELNVDWTLDPA